MPFYLYQYEDLGKRIEFIQTKELKAIPRLMLKSCIEDEFKKRNREPLEWHMNEDDLIYVANKTGLVDSDKNLRDFKYAIVIDLKPNVSNNVSLYWLKDIWGYSYKEWTPLCLRLNKLFADRPEANANEFKKKFSLNNGSKLEDVFEFLYIQAGVKEGRWIWGQVGTVNGALLWPDAMKFFIKNTSSYI